MNEDEGYSERSRSMASRPAAALDRMRELESFRAARKRASAPARLPDFSSIRPSMTEASPARGEPGYRDRNDWSERTAPARCPERAWATASQKPASSEIGSALAAATPRACLAVP